MIKKDFTPNRGYFAKDIIKARPISQVHIINIAMKTIHNLMNYGDSYFTNHSVMVGLPGQATAMLTPDTG